MDILRKKVQYFLATYDKSKSHWLVEETEEKSHTDTFFFYRLCIFVPAIIIILIVMLMEKRTTSCPRCCNGYFALVIPVNFLENRRDRITILSTFAIITIDVLRILIEKDFITSNINVFLKVLIRIALVLFVCIMGMPFLICFTAATYTSLILGILYMIEYIVIMNLDQEKALATHTVYLADYVDYYSADIITGVFAILLLYGYFRKIYHKFSGKKPVQDIQSYQYVYMKGLLSNKINKQNLKEMMQSKFKVKVDNCWKKHIYYNIPGFRYSLSLLVSITVGLVAITYLFIKYLAEIIDAHRFFMFDVIDVYLENMKDVPMPHIVENIAKLVFKKVSFSGAHEIYVYDFVREQVFVLLGSSLTALVTAYLTALFIALHMLRSYRENVLSLLRRKEDEHLLKIKNQNNVKLVVSAVQYAGYQAAYLVWGVHIQYFMLTLSYVILCEIVILPFKYSFWPIFLEILEKIYPIVCIMLLTKGTQFLLVKFAFLQERGNLLALDNRKGFFTMMFFMLFYNIFMGLFSCILRMTKVAIFGIWFIPRIDRSIFPRSFENFDSGFKAYTCLLKLEAMQSNIIVTTFIRTLMEKRKCDHLLTNCDITDNDDERKHVGNEKRRRNVAKNRWFIAYTLIRNPSLIEKRGPHPFLDDYYDKYAHLKYD